MLKVFFQKKLSIPDFNQLVKKNKILLTGVLGFIGFHTAYKLIKLGYNVYGIDNINNYYDTNLKLSKLPLFGLKKHSKYNQEFIKSDLYENFLFAKIDLKDRDTIVKIFKKYKFHSVINLAAQAGVQYSLKNPYTYIENNITGFINLIENSKNNNVKHFIYASSSSIYGDRKEVPFSEYDNADKPISLYAASKKSNELIAHSYSHLYDLKTTALRFFTVYGPWGRPDMAPFIFLNKILNNQEIDVYNNGQMLRDFTFIDDIVKGIIEVLLSNKNQRNNYEVFNIGNSDPIMLLDFIKKIEKVSNKKAKIKFKPLRMGDVVKTYSDSSKLFENYNYKPNTSLSTGLQKFYKWYINFFEFK